MKFKKFAAIALAATMALSAFAACDNSSSKKSHKDKEKVEKEDEDEDEEEEETEEAEESEETEATEETTEETEPAETSEEATHEYDFDTDDEKAMSEFCFKAFMDFIDDYEDKNPGTLYNFTSYAADSDFEWDLLVKTGEDKYDVYGIVDAEVVKLPYEAEWTTENAVEYDVIKTLPVFMETFDYTYVTELPDGEYYGDMIGFLDDGSKAAFMIGKPIIISPEQYESLEDDQELFDIDGNDTDFIVTIDEDGTMFFGGMWFVEREDGNYILMTDSDIKVTYDHQCVILDIADDAKISDSFSYLYDNGEFTPSSDKKTAFTQTSFYYYATEDEYTTYLASNYNGWTFFSGIVEPIIVEDGVVTEMALGWR